MNLNKTLPLVNTLLDIKKKTDPYEKLRQDPNAKEVLQKMSAILLAKQRLNDVITQKQQIMESGTPEQRLGQNVGPIAGRWQVGSQFDQYGQENPPNMLSTIFSLLNPEASKERANLFSNLKQFEQTAFEFGGEQLTGRELAATVGAWPTKFHDDAEFLAVGKKWINIDAPNYLKNSIRQLIRLGHDPDVVIDFVKDVGLNSLEKDLREQFGKTKQTVEE
ncbi:MAG: hypothetical protein KBA02_00295 [Paludibacteraceae bacterium]|nr:hypothetical protein [Paludibacteraceae bacterium]